jgi:hypothetical protein
MKKVEGALRVAQGDNRFGQRPRSFDESGAFTMRQIDYSAGTVTSGRVSHTCDADGANPSTPV